MNHVFEASSFNKNIKHIKGTVYSNDLPISLLASKHVKPLTKLHFPMLCLFAWADCASNMKASRSTLLVTNLPTRMNQGERS